MPFARSDLAYVFISQAHGGCGQPHSRPVVQGAPANVWEVTCPQCSDHLRNDALWSDTISDIPETHDEQKAREDFEKRGAKDKDAILTLALAKLAGVDPDLLPASLTQMVSGAKAHVPQTMDCSQGHPNALDASFCSQCGERIYAPGEAPRVIPAQPPGPAAESAPEPPSAPQGVPWPSNTAMRNADKPNLARIAREHGLDDSGTRADLLNRLIEAANAAR